MGGSRVVALNTPVPPKDFVECHAPSLGISEAEVRQRVLTDPFHQVYQGLISPCPLTPQYKADLFEVQSQPSLFPEDCHRRTPVVYEKPGEVPIGKQ